MLRLLLDQMIDNEVAVTLRSHRYDVVRVSEIGMARADDSQILEQAIVDNRVLITLDEHFGNWCVLPLSSHSGVIRIKANPAITKTILSVLLPFLSMHKGARFNNRLVIIGAKRSRWIHTDGEK
jgi:predicted nuclease of predicted toxin-antitoxin system